MLAIGAMMGAKSPFVAPMDKRQQADQAKLRFNTAASDHIAWFNAYRDWRLAKANGTRCGREFCADNFLSANTMQSIQDTSLQLAAVLTELGFLRYDALSSGEQPSDRRSAMAALIGSAYYNANSHNEPVLKGMLCAALYPRVIKIRQKKKFVATVEGSMQVAAKAKEHKFFTRDDGRVFLHPASINFHCDEFSSAFLLYSDKVQTTKVFIRDSTTITPYCLLLFGGNIAVKHERSNSALASARFLECCVLEVNFKGL